MSHDDFDFEPVRGLPAHLPAGERLLWQGTPDWRSLAVRAYQVRKIAGYFAVLVAWRIGVGLYAGHTASDIGISCLLLVSSGVSAIAVLSVLAYLTARSTIYSITTRRVILRHGVAVPLTMNIPFRLIDSASLKSFKDGTDDIALGLPAKERVGYLITWPHLRPDKLTRPQPSLKALKDGRQAAQILGAALAAEVPAAAARTPATAIEAPGAVPPGGIRPLIVEPPRGVEPRSRAAAPA